MRTCIAATLAALTCSISAFGQQPFAPAAPAAAAGAATIPYTIQRGDSVSEISRKLEGPKRWEAVREVNPGLQIHQIQPGRVLNLPIERLRGEPASARVASITGSASLDALPVVANMPIAVGQTMRVAAGGFVTLELPSGARIRVSGDSVVRFTRLDEVPLLSAKREVLRVDAGRVETAAPPVRRPGARFEISTPTAIAAVRGTTFRVGAEPDAMLTEVVEGSVNVASGASAVNVPPLFGLRAEANKPMQPPLPLPPAPDLSQVPAKFERSVVAFSVTAPPGGRVRARLALDPAFERVVAEGVFPAEAIVLAGIADGEYRLAVRAIGGSGLEGIEASRPIVVEARLDPPRITLPRAGTRLRGDNTRVEWGAVGEASRYSVQVAPTVDGVADFAKPSIERESAESAIDLPIAAGAWSTRVAAIDAGGRSSRYSDSTGFAVIASPPAGPKPSAEIGATAVTLRWSAISDHRTRWQLATDPDFATIIVEHESDATGAIVPLPRPGQYYVRVQAVASDGLRGAFGPPIVFDIVQPPPPNEWWPILFLLLLIVSA